MAKYNLEMKPGEDIERYYRRLAKVADQRLVRLEKLAQQEGFAGVTNYAYQRAMRDIEQWQGAVLVKKPRFNTKPPANVNQLKAKINDIRTFLGAETSTKSGIMRIYVKRANSINEKYGTNLTWEDLYDFYGKNKDADLNNKYASKTIIQAIGVIQKKLGEDDGSLKELQRRAHTRAKFSDDTHINSAVKEILKSSQDIDEMYSFLK